jgi:hypothetical protein
MHVRDCYIHDISTNGLYFEGGAMDVVVSATASSAPARACIMVGYDTSPEFFDITLNPSTTRRSAAPGERALVRARLRHRVHDRVRLRRVRLRFVQPSNGGATQTTAFGASGYVAVPGDYDGDRRTDLAVYHEPSGLWYVRSSSTGTSAATGFGGPGYQPVN